jgi:hypothetical protein
MGSGIYYTVLDGGFPITVGVSLWPAALHLRVQRVTLIDVTKKIEKLTTGVHQVSASQRAKTIPH